jgi:hypothetical protein
MMAILFRKLAIVAYMILLIPDLANCQDSHYATQQFGSRSTLMGGATVGYARDNSSIFYNPGSLSFVDSNSITLTANMYQMEHFRMENPTGTGENLIHSSVGSVPLMVGGMLGQGKNRFKIGYGVISPTNFSFNSTTRSEGIFPVVNEIESPGNEEFIGQSTKRSQLNEVVGILGFGYKLNQHWGIGLANMAMGRSQNFSENSYARFYLNDSKNTLSTYSNGRELQFFHLRYGIKLGVCYRNKGFSAGFAFMPPTIGVAGNGSVATDVLGTNLWFENERQDVLANDRQQNLAIHYRSPFMVSAGLNWNRGRSSFGLAAQFHGRKPEYLVFDPAVSGFALPAKMYEQLGGRRFLQLKDGARPVLNFSFAYEYSLFRNLNLIASFATNQTSYDTGLDSWQGLKTQISTWDLYHVRMGLTVKQGHSQLSLGLLYGFGNDPSRSVQGEFNVTHEDQLLNPVPSVTKAGYYSVGLLLGYSFLLFDI